MAVTKERETSGGERTDVVVEPPDAIERALALTAAVVILDKSGIPPLADLVEQKMMHDTVTRVCREDLALHGAVHDERC